MPIGAVHEPLQPTFALTRVKCRAVHSIASITNLTMGFTRCALARMSLMFRFTHPESEIGSLGALLICAEPITHSSQMVGPKKSTQ